MNRHPAPQLRASFISNIDWRSLSDNLTDTELTSAGSGDMMETNKAAAIAKIVGVILGGLFLVVVLPCSIFLVYNLRKQKAETNGEAEASLEEVEDNTLLAFKIFKMSPEKRVELYSKAFDKNKHQTVLEASSIIVNSKGDNASDTEEEESSDFGQDEDRSIYLALQDIRAKRRSTILESSSIKLGVPSGTDDGSNANMGSSHNFSKQRRKSSIVHPRNSILGALNGISKADSLDKENLVRGNCVICFEDMQAGETVVWSENKSCPHVYHKDCMVAYLAHIKQSIEEIKKDENPCPTCRQKFVTVCPSAKVAKGLGNDRED